MRAVNRKKNWIIDAILFAAVLSCFWLDFTGVGMHQWIGLGIILLTGYHLLVHLKWVKAVSKRFFNHTTWAARLNYLIDFALMIAFGVILITGIQISTWISLPSDSIWFERHLHIEFSILTLVLLVIKIGFHWRWILQNPSKRNPRTVIPHIQQGQPQPVLIKANSGRREFLKLVGLTGGAAFLSITGVIDALDEGQVLPYPEVATIRSADTSADTAGVQAPLEIASTIGISEAGSINDQSDGSDINSARITPTPTVIVPVDYSSQPQTDSAAVCYARCDRGCSYPGHCRKYQDQNGNNLCDLGECA